MAAPAARRLADLAAEQQRLALATLLAAQEELLERAAASLGDLTPLQHYKVSEVAALLSLDADSVTKLIKAGELETVALAGLSLRRIPRLSLERYLARSGSPIALPAPSLRPRPRRVT